jgi:hypothetical protein
MPQGHDAGRSALALREIATLADIVAAIAAESAVSRRGRPA